MSGVENDGSKRHRLVGKQSIKRPANKVEEVATTFSKRHRMSDDCQRLVAEAQYCTPEPVVLGLWLSRGNLPSASVTHSDDQNPSSDAIIRKTTSEEQNALLMAPSTPSDVEEIQCDELPASHGTGPPILAPAQPTEGPHDASSSSTCTQQATCTNRHDLHVARFPLFSFPQGDDKPRLHRNLGQSCFINASLTALYGPQRIKSLLYNLYQLRHDEYNMGLWNVAMSPTGLSRESDYALFTNDDRLAVSYASCFHAPRGQMLVPRLFTNRYYHGQQEDAHEFLCDMLGAAPEVNALLLGDDTATLMCPHVSCRVQIPKVRPDPFGQLNLKLVDDRTQPPRIVTSVQEAINLYFAPAPVDDDLWEDRPCAHVGLPPVQQHVITKFPQVLLLTLGRWNDLHNIISNHIVPDETLTVQGKIYVLRSVINHMGSTAHSGHYFCYMRHETPHGSWWYYNDNGVRRLLQGNELKDGRQPGAIRCEGKTYILFYELADS